MHVGVRAFHDQRSNCTWAPDLRALPFIRSAHALNVRHCSLTLRAWRLILVFADGVFADGVLADGVLADGADCHDQRIRANPRQSLRERPCADSRAAIAG